MRIDRFLSLPDPLRETQESGTPKGRCKSGAPAGSSWPTPRDSWDIWLDIHTGEGGCGGNHGEASNPFKLKRACEQETEHEAATGNRPARGPV
jgi:hypothetical protein